MLAPPPELDQRERKLQVHMGLLQSQKTGHIFLTHARINSNTEEAANGNKMTKILAAMSGNDPMGA